MTRLWKVIVTVLFTLSMAACGLGNQEGAFGDRSFNSTNLQNGEQGYYHDANSGTDVNTQKINNDDTFIGNRDWDQNGNIHLNISASSTNLSSDKYPHTKAILLQEAKYSFTNISEEQIAQLQRKIEEQLRQRFGKLTEQHRNNARKQAEQQLMRENAQQQKGNTQQGAAPNGQGNVQPNQQGQTNQPQATPNQGQTKQPANGQTGSTPSANISSIAQQVVDLTNQERAKEGLPALKADAQLTSVAQTKSEDMRKNNYFSHTSPTYGSPFDMMRDFGISYKTAGENIAQGQPTPQEVVQAWMNSPGHRANIMNANFTHIGIGYDANGHHWTQMFIGR